MPHLNLETLARVVDDGPTIEEARHLDRRATTAGPSSTRCARTCTR
jgi:hypothetical protein